MLTSKIIESYEIKTANDWLSFLFSHLQKPLETSESHKLQSANGSAIWIYKNAINPTREDELQSV